MSRCKCIQELAVKNALSENLTEGDELSVFLLDNVYTYEPSDMKGFGGKKLIRITGLFRNGDTYMHLDPRYFNFYFIDVNVDRSNKIEQIIC